MLRRIFLTEALDRLVEEGKIRRRSKAARILRLVIDNGVSVLDDTQRELYDHVLIPQIERLQIRLN